ncbi:hypothetical protein D9M71_794210 [compost metagenome]
MVVISPKVLPLSVLRRITMLLALGASAAEFGRASQEVSTTPLPRWARAGMR